ncbi:MAG: TraB/GumN family protein [Caulobacteraceae bacterium]|nr:TraB/GumN family protein [Caulobacteraceae bacterium]
MRGWAGLLCALLALGAAPAWAKPPIWVAHGPEATVVLFGSVHILPDKLDWEPQALTDALKDADELWFETPIDAGGLLEGARLALAKGVLPDGETLSALLTPAQRERLKATAADLGLPMAQLDRLRPWLAELSLAQAAYAREGAFADQGVERQLAQSAPQAGRHAFETPAQQIALFAGAAAADQVASLMDTVRELREDPDAYRRLMRDWLSGDLKALDRDGVQPLRRASPALFKALLTDRNAAWVETLRKRLAGRGKVVVVVGVGHLIGPGGVPQLLRGAGVRVDGPKP